MRENVPVLEDESVEDLQLGGLMLIQKRKGFRFGVDAVLLADFAKGIRSSKTLDLCTGTGAVAVLLAGKTATAHIDALELQKPIADMAKRTVLLNALENRVTVTQGDVKDFDLYYAKRSYDVITCNPPYAEAGTALKNNDDMNTISRHEVKCTLDDVVRAAGQLLKHGGHLVMVHRPARIADVTEAMRRYDIEPKRMRLVYPDSSKAPNLLLIDGTYKGGHGLKFMPPLFVFDRDGRYSREIDEIYGRC